MSVEVVGPLGIREFQLAKKCEANQGHRHNYDHATIVIRGALKVYSKTTEDGEEKESVVFREGARFTVLANVYHRIVALEDQTRYLCVFSHRDFEGLVTQEYMGNEEAYN